MFNNQPKEPWRESLFDICASPKLCCAVVCCCDGCVFGANAAIINETSCFGYGCVYCLLSPLYLCGLVHMPVRAKMREKYNLVEEPSDFIAACLLSPLALCQEAREIEYREKLAGKKTRTVQPLSTADPAPESEMSSNNDASQTS